MVRSKAEPAHLEAAVRIGTIMALPAALRSLGVNPIEVLAEAGFDLTLFDDPDNRISYTARNLCFPKTYITLNQAANRS